MLLSGAIAQAQGAPAIPATAPETLADDMAKYDAMFKSGFFDEIIDSGSFKEEFGVTTEQFYQQWGTEIARQLATR